MQGSIATYGSMNVKGYPGYFPGKNYLGEMRSGRFVAVTSQNALSRPPASVGNHRRCHRNAFFRIVWHKNMRPN
jgi:hypothetical protein